MKLIKITLITAMLLLTPGYAFCSNIGYMRVSLADGDVQVKTPEAGDWGLAPVNTPLAEGDQVWTPEGSRVELQLNNGTYIRLDENSSLQILSMDGDSSQFYLSQGRAYIHYDAPRGSVIQVDTPDASTRAFNRAAYSMDISDSHTDATVYKGYVEAENRMGMTRINAGTMLSLGQDTDGEIAPMGPEDEWEDWNYDRDDRIFASRYGSARYLPAELRTYASDFDGNGRWLYVPEYGYCWTPTVNVGLGWSPFRAGRWIWRDGDYVWVASEPWGWAPYHYGRWAFVASVGWCWVPPSPSAVYWGPGYVGWVRTPDYVAWVPLAPGETYYGRRYYGPHTVNVTNMNINQVNITNVNVYRNVYVNNGVTVVNRRTFNTASPAIVHFDRDVIRRNIFVRNNISIGAPAIRPTRASFFASARPVPAAKLPPRPIRNVRITELKTERPLIRTPGRSVMNPGTGGMRLPVTNAAKPWQPGTDRVASQRTRPEDRGIAGRSFTQGPTDVRRQIPINENAGTANQGSRSSAIEGSRAKPSERGDRGALDVPVSRGEWQQHQPATEMQSRGSGGSTANRENPRALPFERMKPAPPYGGDMVKGTPQIRQADKTPHAIEGAAGRRGEWPQPRPVVKPQPAGSPYPAPRVEKPQARPAEKGNAGARPAPAKEKPRDGNEKPQANSEKKEKPAKPAEHVEGFRREL